MKMVGVDQAVKNLAAWIIDRHGCQDWKVKAEECSEPVAVALGVPFDGFRKMVAKEIIRQDEEG